jgi:hypothetical protein
VQGEAGRLSAAACCCDDGKEHNSKLSHVHILSK